MCDPKCGGDECSCALQEHLWDCRACMRVTGFLWFVFDPAIALNDAKHESADVQDGLSMRTDKKDLSVNSELPIARMACLLPLSHLR